MKKLVLPLPLLLLSFAFADGSSADLTDTSPSPSTSPLDTQMYNLQARPSVKDSCDFWIMGDALYWQAIEEKLTYVYSGSPQGAIPNNHDLHSVSFDWDLGFRVGSGFNFVRDGWDVALYWTSMENNARGSQRANSHKALIQAVSSTTEILSPPITRANAHWHINLDQVDLQLGRESFIGKHLTLRPYIGMRSTFLFQKFNVLTANATASQKARAHNQFWGYGFSIGMDTDWLFKKGFSLYANADYSLLLGFFKLREKCTQEDVLQWFFKRSFRAGRSVMDLAMGLKWAGLFCKDRFGLTFKAGYEYHLYFNQNQFFGNKAAVNGLDHYSSQGGNLIYQGVIGSAQFDF
ncbi:MAG: Lpg1974 family pore-forming outer membrane protein [Chlamydiota bacterium]